MVLRPKVFPASEIKPIMDPKERYKEDITDSIDLIYSKFLSAFAKIF